jgi:hypothetical protein
VKRLVALTVDVDGDERHTVETITATEGHPFWVDGNGEQFGPPGDDDGHWSDAGDLRIGDRLKTPKGGGSVAVLDRKTRTELRTVYNLTVDGVHTYYIESGDTAIVTHNCGKNIYVPSGKHGPVARGSSRGTNSAEPTNGQAALDNSLQMKATAPRRVGIDKENDEIAVLDRDGTLPCDCGEGDGWNNRWHGHVREFGDFDDVGQNFLKRNGLVDKKGRIIK